MKPVVILFSVACIASIFPVLVLAKADSSPICPAGTHGVKAHFRRAYVRSDGTQVSSAHVSAHCQLDPPAYAKWKDRLKSKPSSRWLLRHEKPRKWTIEEEERVLEALSGLPPWLLVDSIAAMFRLEKSSLYDRNPAAGESGEIAVYDLAFGPKSNLSRILGHELAHEVFRQFSNTEKDRYRTAADWLLVKNPRAEGGYQLVPNRDSAAFVEDDGMESVTEDFSNNIEYFVFDPETLRRKTPRVYEWIKKKFGDNFRGEKGARK